MVERWIPVPGGTEVVSASDYDALAARMEASTDYSIKLQQLIENLKYPESEVRFPELHHHKMIVAAKARIRELEAALTSVLAQPDNPTIWFGVVRGCFKSETTVESREPKTPEDWEYWPEKPMHSMSVHHRGRIVDDIWRCWDCPATHGVEYTSDRAVKP